MHQTLLSDGTCVGIELLEEGVFRVRASCGGSFVEPLLTRYNVLRTDWEPMPSAAVDTETACSVVAGAYRATVGKCEHELCFFGSSVLRIALSGAQGGRYGGSGFRMDIRLSDDERLYGLGDETRDRIMKRGHRADLWQSNIACYGPIPYIMSSRGWGVLVNCTYRHIYDVAAENPNLLRIDSARGPMDFYVFLGGDLKALLNLYTDVSGKPILLPRAAYGLTFVCNEEYGAHELLEDCRHFRREEIPCDIMGLEPGWMDKRYDFSVDKKWDPEKFYIVHWRSYNEGGPDTFFAALKRMGFKLSLWLCCDYDLFWEEEKTSFASGTASFEDARIDDERLGETRLMDTITRQGEPWFEHLKKFVDQGVSAFKLDGADQIVPHPDRLWAGKYLDDEIHNLYPAIYGKQMKEGFSRYTGRRALIYTPGLYAGTQQYCASWAGDTGGDNKTLVSILNLALCGHSNATCDLDADTVAGIHYGFLLPWSQQLTWRNWMHPWFLGDELETAYRFYAQLRSSLFPYLYSMAHIAARTGFPVVRPLCLAYPENPEYDSVTNAYMLGDSLLVGAFDMRMKLPPGGWTDFWTGERHEGNREINYAPPKGRGGALFARDGAIFALQPWMSWLGHHVPEKLDISVYPGADGSFTLCEDDGETYGYLKGEAAHTEMRIANTAWAGGALACDIFIGRREGRFEGMKDACAFDVIVHTARPPRSIVHGADCVLFSYDEALGIASFHIPAKQHAERDLMYSVVI